MKRAVFLLPILALAGTSASAVRAPLYEDSGIAREALRRALVERREAEQRSERLEAAATRAVEAAEKTAQEAAALAARIQQAEAGISAAEARTALIDRELADMREELGGEQGPVVRLTAALQQFSRRPVALSVLRPGSVKEIVYTRAALASAVPEVRQRTAQLRARLARSRELRGEAERNARALRAEESRLAERRRQLAELESRQRLASRDASGSAVREAERALALAEQARDLDSLLGELGRAGELRSRLAALPGPVLRPERPEDAQLAAAPPFVEQESAAGPPPSPYLLPVTGRTVRGFRVADPVGVNSGITLAPRGGAQVVAPAAGRVAFAGPYRGYGRIVIIEHDGGWTSLVTGLARLDVRVGQALVAGAPLGVAGQGQPAVSLELRRGGEPVNPLQYVG